MVVCMRKIMAIPRSCYVCFSAIIGTVTHWGVYSRFPMVSFLVPVQTPPLSCAEPNWWMKDGKRAASESIWYDSSIWCGKSHTFDRLSNLTKTRRTVRRLNQITILVVGRDNLTVFETTSIRSVLLKESRPPTSSRPARVALVFRHSCDDILVNHAYQITLSTLMKVMNSCR